LPARDLGAAYAVQAINIARRRAAGSRVIGRKIGVTSPGAQKHMGIDHPTSGFLLEGMARSPASPLALEDFIAPQIEGEIAFLIGADIAQPPASGAALAARVQAVTAAFEIVDSAIIDWKVDIVDAIADNACCGELVVGDWVTFDAGSDLTAARMSLTLDGTVVSAGAGSACVGGPLAALAWLATSAIAAGEPLRAAEVVMAGALGPMVPLVAGEWKLLIDGFAPVTLRAA
jgi:2-keto-4-pentenoate hydratase